MRPAVAGYISLFSRFWHICKLWRRCRVLWWTSNLIFPAEDMEGDGERGRERGYQRGDAFEIRSFLPPTNNLLNWATLQMLSHQRIQFCKGLKFWNIWTPPPIMVWIVILHCYIRIIFIGPRYPRSHPWVQVSVSNWVSHLLRLNWCDSGW